MKTSTIHFAQISDCHLYANKLAKHYGVNVFDSLCSVLLHINNSTTIEFIVFTGDLTQDHSEQSYKNFLEAVKMTNTSLPIYFLAGNHDDHELLNKYLKNENFRQESMVEDPYWQVLLVNSKSETPAGLVLLPESKRLLEAVSPDKNQFILMHHHPTDVGYFIDKHGLKNKTDFYQTLDKIKNLQAIACGHVHNSMELIIKTPKNTIPLFTCPATSIQFEKLGSELKNSGANPGYRVFTLNDNGNVQGQTIFLKNH